MNLYWTHETHKLVVIALVILLTILFLVLSGIPFPNLEMAPVDLA